MAIQVAPQARNGGQTHGDAQDLLENGATLAEILQAGQWRSSSFVKYLKEAELEREVAFLVSIESDDED